MKHDLRPVHTAIPLEGAAAEADLEGHSLLRAELHRQVATTRRREALKRPRRAAGRHYPEGPKGRR